MVKIEKQIETFSCGTYNGYDFLCDVVKSNDCVDFWLYADGIGKKEHIIGLPFFQPCENKTYTYGELLEIGEPTEEDFEIYVNMYYL